MTARRVLCVFPRYARSFGTFDHALPLVGAKAFMPPQGILVIAAVLPAGWQVRLVDENVRPVTDPDLDWAEVLFLTGMHVQHGEIGRLNARARARGVLTVLGGPSVSASPQWYPDVDLLHLGELGDATEALIQRLEASVRRPPAQERYTTIERRPLEQFPVPAYHQIDLADYFIASVQFSSGCPFQCEFCDIPELYGRSPRVKSPAQVCAELDAMLASGHRPDAVYFVDDNFVGNPHAARPLLTELVNWQQRHGYPVEFACEASLNIVKHADVLALMRQARFATLFAGIETPDTEALRSLNKRQNLRSPVLEAVATLNRYGIEVVSGIIIGLDTDTPATYPQISAFIDASGIPLLTINLLHALPRTPLWRRLAQDGRLVAEPGDRESNVEFLLPYEVVADGWRQVIEHAYTPAHVYGRFRRQLQETYPHRLSRPATSQQVDRSQLARGLLVLARTVWTCGVRADYRREFWRLAVAALRQRDIESLLHAAIVSHHLITFAREALSGQAEKAFYAPHQQVPLPAGAVAG